MKAAVLVANEDIRYMDIKEPDVSDGTVKVKVAVSGICGSDIPRVLYNGAHYYPIVLGHEFSGEVVETGNGVSSVKVGDRVAGVPLVPCMACVDCQKGNYALCKHYSFIGSRQNGSNADYVVLPERNVVVLDKSVSFEQGALFEPSTVALHGVLQNQHRGDGIVAVLGAGTIGIFTIQWARLMGARKVVAFDISDERLELAKRLGADETINTLKEEFLADAMSLTGGIGFDYIYETAGATATMRIAFKLAAAKAKVCFIGTPHTQLCFQPAEWEYINRKEFTLTGSWMSYSAPFPGKEWKMTAEFFVSNRLKFDENLIDDRIPMSRAQEAFLKFKNPGAVKGKILLVNQ
ncbi:MAG TPA: galactitol-1-phosphate 5-dehydrogenase [Thermoclostridium caenicola]|uniref:galactitol-1-phosphate 5-dehydrogenase n=1 Tax=Thermoclostridium caenicola TaxID=659425 RepID=UPI002B729CCC|nr:galactitol-1-phosphate 5-dehydrogenase [Thermoclostridium caenicola]HOK42637.1 galactitol-1-phosphate 5-dehydrogenase [Thermoclostridium caenicola]HOL84293.1 galactitol-1-phosphate 5-dehydrogenase [Thermoclostridium caenicola]HPO75669.1 galactitol-1-phosphate 5-dehydrogenase [Thermoclostridium caenicola]